jgi:tRNA U34 2-thiouridine synthase MnmA/TrmU
VALNKAILKIYLNEKVSWRYELQAKTIYRSTDEARSFKLATRNKSEQLVEFNLPYSEEYSGQTVRLVIIGCDQTDNFLKGAIKTVNNG